MSKSKPRPRITVSPRSAPTPARKTKAAPARKTKAVTPKTELAPKFKRAVSTLRSNSARLDHFWMNLDIGDIVHPVTADQLSYITSEIKKASRSLERLL